MVRLKGGKGGRVVRLRRQEVDDFGKVGKVEGWSGGKVGVSWFYSRLGDAEWLQDIIFLFLVLIKGTKRQDEVAIGIACAWGL